MNIETLLDKKSAKETELASIAEKVSSKIGEIRNAEHSIEKAIAQNKPDMAVQLTRTKRELEDELHILQSVQGNLNGTPAYSVHDLNKVWCDIVDESESAVEAIYPRLKSAFEAYQSALDEFVAIRNQASRAGRRLKLMAKGEGVLFEPSVHFKRKSCIELWDRKANVKLSCFDSLTESAFWLDMSEE